MGWENKISMVILTGRKYLCIITAELQLTRLIGMASHPDMKKIRITGVFFENRLQWHFEVRLLLFTVNSCAQTFRPRLI
jgi:hypothetical protein